VDRAERGGAHHQGGQGEYLSRHVILRIADQAGCQVSRVHYSTTLKDYYIEAEVEIDKTEGKCIPEGLDDTAV
jgi:hypothetical protein